jgi:putative transposase
LALGQVCARSGWRVHAFVLMRNHYHLLIETPQPNLVAGMRWFQSTYTMRFNRRHGLSGHLFQGRYKAQLIDGRSAGYLRTACDYVHLNPVRARLVLAEERLESYRWSSYPAYRCPQLRPGWLRLDNRQEAIFGDDVDRSDFCADAGGGLPPHGLAGAR